MAPSDKRLTILDAAQDQFLRYGYRRVTMGDIAQAAKMSRPALYQLFPNKESIYKAVFARFVDASLSEIETNLGGYDGAAEQLRFAVEVWVVKPYELLYQTPEGRELAECNYDFASELVDQSYRRYNEIIESIFVKHKKALEIWGLTPATSAEIFSMSLRGIKVGAKDAKHLNKLIANLISLSIAPLAS